MSLDAELKSEVAAIFKATWSERDGRVVPSDTDVTLANDCVKLDGVVLYADLHDSTGLVDQQVPHFAAEIYKTFLRCAAKIISSEGGELTAYDGDRIMAVYLGGQKNTSAARSALKLNYAKTVIINPAIETQYGTGKYVMKHVVGVDSSELHVAKTGIRGANDLVWVGRAANHAAKLCALPADYPSYITEPVYNMLPASVKVTDGKSMWEKVTWTSQNRTIYRSTWQWAL